MTMADVETDVIPIPDEEEFYSADEATADTPPPREFLTPLPPDVMEEIASITNKLVKFKEKKNPEIEDALNLFIQEWRTQTKQEIEDLKKLKDRVLVRREQRAEEEARYAEMRREEEELRIRMIEEEKQRKQEEKMKRLQDAEMKRQKLMEEQNKGRNFKIVSTGREQTNEQQNTSRELTKEEYEAMKEAALSVIIKPLEIGGLRRERLKRRAAEMWDKIVKLETERYDLEEKRTRQEYDFKELKERQKQQLRQKALKLGLDPEALTGKYPPKIRVASKYERRKGLRPFGETKGLFEGGFVEESKKKVEEEWMHRQEVFTKRNPDDLPPWLADMPRQIIKQIEEEEAAIRAVILQEEVEGKKQPEEENEDANENETGENEGEAAEKGEKGEEEEEEEVEGEGEEPEEEGVEKKEIVIEDEATPASEEREEKEEEESVAETEEAEETEEVAAEEEAAEEEEEVEEVEEEEAASEKTSEAQQQEKEVEEEEAEEEEEVDVVPQEEEEAEEEEEEEV